MYGYEFGTAPSRLKDLGHSLPILLDRLAKLNPAPVRQPIPIMIGGGGEKVTLRLVAQYADQWNFIGVPETVAHKCKVLDEWCRKVGRDPAEIERSVLLMRPDDFTHLDAHYDSGIRHFIFGVGIPFDLDPAQKLLEWRKTKG